MIQLSSKTSRFDQPSEPPKYPSLHRLGLQVRIKLRELTCLISLGGSALAVQGCEPEAPVGTILYRCTTRANEGNLANPEKIEFGNHDFNLGKWYEFPNGLQVKFVSHRKISGPHKMNGVGILTALNGKLMRANIGLANLSEQYPTKIHNTEFSDFRASEDCNEQKISLTINGAKKLNRQNLYKDCVQEVKALKLEEKYSPEGIENTCAKTLAQYTPLQLPNGQSEKIQETNHFTFIIDSRIPKEYSDQYIKNAEEMFGRLEKQLNFKSPHPFKIPVRLAFLKPGYSPDVANASDIGAITVPIDTTRPLFSLTIGGSRRFPHEVIHTGSHYLRGYGNGRWSVLINEGLTDTLAHLIAAPKVKTIESDKAKTGSILKPNQFNQKEIELIEILPNEMVRVIFEKREYNLAVGQAIEIDVKSIDEKLQAVIITIDQIEIDKGIIHYSYRQGDFSRDLSPFCHQDGGYENVRSYKDDDNKLIPIINEEKFREIYPGKAKLDFKKDNYYFYAVCALRLDPQPGNIMKYWETIQKIRGQIGKTFPANTFPRFKGLEKYVGDKDYDPQKDNGVSVDYPWLFYPSYPTQSLPLIIPNHASKIFDER